jgi:hypothetical protein
MRSEKRRPLIIVVLFVTTGAIIACYLYYVDNLVLLYYGDSVSHLVRARQLVDSSHPGLHEIGTVWLPLPHLVLLPFSLVDLLFKTGFAGTFVSLPSLAITAAILYKILKLQVDVTWIAFLGACLYFLNPNILYLGITAMTEALFMLFFVASAFYFQQLVSSFLFFSPKAVSARSSYSRNHGLLKCKLPNPQIAFKCSLFVALATLCRYEAWPISIFFAVFGTLYHILLSRDLRKSGISVLNDPRKQLNTILLCTFMSLFGITIWISYNWIYYASPVEFIIADYFSALFQALEGQNRENLYLQPISAASLYGKTALAFFGPLVVTGAIIGYIIHRRCAPKENAWRRELIYLFLAVPSITSFLTMLFGIGEMNQWWYNSRFLIMLSPLLIMLLSILVKRIMQSLIINRTILTSIIAAVFLVSSIAMPILGGTVTLMDAANSVSYGTRPFAMEIAEVLNSLYNGGKILVITGSAQQNVIMQASGIPLANFEAAAEGSKNSHDLESSALDSSYVIVAKKPDSRAKSYAESWSGSQDELNRYFDKKYENSHYLLFVRNHLAVAFVPERQLNTVKSFTT